MNENIHVVVLEGGISSEREISLKTGKGVKEALREQGFRVSPYDVVEKNLHRLNPSEYDVAFIALHGEFGEDGGVQNCLEQMGLLYTGSGPNASRLAMDKIAAKFVLRKREINVARDVQLKQMDDFKTKESEILELGFPLVVKPVSEGSSLGISLVRDPSELQPAIRKAGESNKRIMLEAFIPGRELTVGILGDQALPIIEIQPKCDAGWFDFEAKYQNDTKYIIPSNLSLKETKKIQEIALEAHKALGCRDVSRVDLRFDESGSEEPVVLEVNTVPGLTKTSLLPKAANLIGTSYASLCTGLVWMSLRRSSKNLEKVMTA